MQQVVTRTTRGRCFLKVCIRIDVETWGKERYHSVSVYEGYLKMYIFAADPSRKTAQKVKFFLLIRQGILATGETSSVPDGVIQYIFDVKYVN